MKTETRNQKTMNAVIISLLIIVAYLFGTSVDNLQLRFMPQSEDNITLILDDELTGREKNYSTKLFNSLNPLYKNKLDRVIFTNNISKYGSRYAAGCMRMYGGPNSCGGANNLAGEIITKFDGVPFSYVKETFCHEILHGWIPIVSNNISMDSAHQIIRDMARKGVCYG